MENERDNAKVIEVGDLRQGRQGGKTVLQKELIAAMELEASERLRTVGGPPRPKTEQVLVDISREEKKFLEKIAPDKRLAAVEAWRRTKQGKRRVHRGR